MNKIWIVVQREFMNRVKKKSFLLLTILMPFVMVGIVFIPLWLSSLSSDDVKNVAIIDRTHKYAPEFKDTDAYHFQVMPDSMTKDKLKDNEDIFAILTIDNDLLEDPKASAVYGKNEIPVGLLTVINNTLSDKMRDDRIAAHQIEGLDRIVAESNISYQSRTLKLDAEGNESSSSSGVAMIVGLVFAFMVYMFILTYGGMVMQSVLEEKTGRIVEIIVSSIKPYQLMAGKIIGLGLVGILQFLIWGVLVMTLITVVSLLFGVPMSGAETAMPATGAVGSLTPETNEMLQSLYNINIGEICLMFLCYFIGGYLLFASLFAAIGASVNAQEDSQQFMMPIMLLQIFSLYAGMYSIENPDGPLAFWCSLFPLTSPIVMMIRVPFGVPLWQEVLSLGLLFLTTTFIVWAAGQVYRVGILLYGKKPTFMEMLRWIRYR